MVYLDTIIKTQNYVQSAILLAHASETENCKEQILIDIGKSAFLSTDETNHLITLQPNAQPNYLCHSYVLLKTIKILDPNLLPRCLTPRNEKEALELGWENEQGTSFT